MEQNTQKIFRITVDYQTANANLEEVKKKIKELHEANRGLVRQQRESDRQFKSGGISQAEYTALTKANQQAMILNRQSLTALNDEKRRATMETNKLAISEKAGSGSMLQMQSRLIALRSQYRQLTEAQRNNADVGGKLQREIEQLSNKYRKLEISIGNTSANVGNYIGAFSKVQGTFGMITAGLYAVKKAFQPFVDFEYQMDRVAAVSSATAEQFKQLTEDARRLGEATEYTASEVAELQLNYARLGFSPDEIIEVTRATLDLATATGEDLAKSADVAGATLRGFRFNASEMPRVVDVMAASFNKSALSLDNFTESIKYVAPIAASAGVSLEQTTAMLGVLADAGIRGSMAGTAMRRILTEVATSGKPLNEALQELTQNGLSLQGSFGEVGRHAMTALNVLANGSEQVNSLTIALNDSAGAAKVAADAMRDNLQGDIDKAMSKLEGVAIWFGDVFTPILRGAVQLFTALLTPIKVATVAVAAWFATLKIGKVAVDAYNLSKRRFSVGTKDSTLALLSETAAMNANTIAAKRNLVTIRSMPAITKAWAAAKLLLAGNFKAAALAAKMFFASIGPVGWLALGIGTVVGALAIFSDKSKEASDASSQLALELAQEKTTYNDLKKAVEKNEQGSKARAEAIRLINERYKEYLPNMLTDKMSNEEIAAALDEVNQKMEENIKIKIKAKEAERIQQEQFDANKNALDRLIEAYESLEERSETQIAIAKQQFADLIAQLNATGNEGEFAKNALKILGYTLAELQEETKQSISGSIDYVEVMSAIGSALRTIDDASVKAKSGLAVLNSLIDIATKKGSGENVIQSVADRIVDLTGKIKTAKQELEKLRAADSKATADEITAQELEIKRLEKQLETLTGKTDKAAAKIQQKEESTATKRAEFIRKQARKLEDIQSQIKDMEIAGYEDGLNKKLILSERAGQKELTQQQRANADLLTETDKHIAEIQKKGKKQTAEDKAQLEQLNTQREQLVKSGGEIELAIITKNALAREKIMKEANEKELRTFIATQMAMSNYLLANEAAKALQKQQRDAHKSKLNKAKEDYAEELNLIELQHTIEQMMIRKGLLTKRQTREKESQENLRYAQDQLNATKKSQQAIYDAEAELLKKRLNNGEISAQEYERQIKLLMDRVSLIIAQANDSVQGAEQASKRTTWLGNLLGMDDDQVEQLKEQAFRVASEIANTITQIGMENSQHQLKVETERIDKTKDKELKTLDERKRKGVLTEKQYEKQKEAIEKRAEKQKERAEREAFEREKRLKIAQVWTDVAMGIAKIWSEWGTSPFKLPWAIAQTAFLTITGGAQTAQIASAKYAQGGVVDMYSEGQAASFGMIRGRSHASGGNQLSIDGKPIAEVESNETLVILRRGSEAFAPILSEMNASIGGRKFAQGGVVRSPNMKIPTPAPLPRSLFAPNAAVESQFAGFREDIQAAIGRLEANIQAVNTRIDNLRVHVVETDVTEAQNSVRAMVQQATY